jgi:pyruvate/2-oxoacid:ferredoxin oxidoreductase beta subunit/Pyruvate/2-oxoacid:ferredoxin oxidoreductase gamma subunit
LNTTLESYIDKNKLPLPFCPGCGHNTIVEKLNIALVKLQLDPKKVVLVSDIGCNGLSDKYFNTNAFHGLHGRSVTYATGMKLANPELHVIVLIGDGGCGIGGNHLIHAARRNIGITVLVFNNFNYGMTGGEHSVTTPQRMKTTTTPFGHIEQPFDICQTVSVNGAGFVARTTTFDENFSDLIVEAISHDGFSLVDIWELCTAYFVPKNKFTRKTLNETLKELDFSQGVIQQTSRTEYSRAYRCLYGKGISQPELPIGKLVTKFESKLSTPLRIIIIGAAGMKIISAATIFNYGAILAGLWTSQRNDYPVTVKSGFSLSEVILSPQEVVFTGISKPDVLLILFPEGLEKGKPYMDRMTKDDILYINADLLPISTRAKTVPLKFSKGKKRYWALASLAKVLRHAGIYPLNALKEAVALHTKFADEYTAILEADRELVRIA